MAPLIDNPAVIAPITVGILPNVSTNSVANDTNVVKKSTAPFTTPVSMKVNQNFCTELVRFAILKYLQQGSQHLASFIKIVIFVLSIVISIFLIMADFIILFKYTR